MLKTVFESWHKVRAFECDFYGHVNNAIYLNYLEFARMEVLEARGLFLPKLKENGHIIVIRRVDITYRQPALVNEEILIRTRLKSHTQVSGAFYQQVLRKTDETLLAEADVTWVVTNPAGRPIPIPNDIRRPFDIPLRGKRVVSNAE